MVTSNNRQGESGGRSSPRSFLQLTRLDDLPLDKVISYLEDDDLRSFHQVCTAWKCALESRPKQERRRVEAVRRIRENKENILNRTYGSLLSPQAQEPVRANPQPLAQRAIRERNFEVESIHDEFNGKGSGNQIFHEFPEGLNITAVGGTQWAGLRLTLRILRGYPSFPESRYQDTEDVRLLKKNNSSTSSKNSKLKNQKKTALRRLARL